MTANFHDAHCRADRFTTHILQLCAAFNVGIIALEPNEMARAEGGVLGDAPTFEARTRIIRIAQPTDEPTYAAALHELGHVLHPLGMVAYREGSLEYRTTHRPSLLRDVRLILEQERAAWEWAHQHALEWTDVMTFVETTCMAGYLQIAARYGVKP